MGSLALEVLKHNGFEGDEADRERTVREMLRLWRERLR